MTRVQVEVNTRLTAMVDVVLTGITIPDEAELVEVVLHFPNLRPRTVKVPADAFNPNGPDFLLLPKPERLVRP